MLYARLASLPLICVVAACGGGGGNGGSTAALAPTTLAPVAPPITTQAPLPSPSPAPAPASAPANYNAAKLPDGRQRAFPTAEGFGAASHGGRGGPAIAVTTLADSGAGSLRECMMASGPRTCVFRVAGTIELASQIKPTSGQLTLAGQTAPGGGIAIRNTPGNLTGSPIFLNVPDVVIRHVRIRPGPTSGTRQDTTDAITVDAGAARTMIDHVSLSWATDEPFNSTKGASNITVQWSLVYEGLSRSTHTSGEHSKGMFVEGNDVTVHHTLIAHATDRMPNLGVGTRADLVNVLSYDMGQKAHQYFSMMRSQSQANSGLRREANIVANWVSLGPSSQRGSAIYGGDYDEQYSTNPGHAAFYLSGNIDGRRRSSGTDEREFFDPADWRYLLQQMIGVLSVEVYSGAEQAVRDVVAFAGAFPRDASDSRALNNFLACGGRIIDDPAQVGGWPSLANGTAYPDADGDGIDDGWESATGLSNPHADGDGDGYSNLEEFLNEQAGDQDRAGNVLLRVRSGRGNVPAVNCGIPSA